MATGNVSPSPQLERMASELRCPICLSLYKQAASLSCNHCFCTSCIVQSMKRISCCPICKIPATPREVRCAPQMDSLVSIFKGMETSAGVSLFQTQPSQPKNSGAAQQHACQEVNVPRVPKSGGRKKAQVSNNATQAENIKISPPKKRRRGNAELALPDMTNLQTCHATGGGAMKKNFESLARGEDQSIQDFVPVKKRVQRVMRTDSRSDVLASQTKVGEGRPSPSADLPTEGVEHGISSNHFPSLDSLREQPDQLPPFFWLRDRVLPSQDEPPTQPTQTQPTARPLQPSFSDLKGSDDEQSEDVQQPQDEVASRGPLDADSYDSDTFVWTQRPCSPELCSSPFKDSDKLPDFQHKIINKQEETERDGKIPHGFDDEELRCSPKRIVESPVGVEATQTPQLHQEPVRVMKGTLSKCSRVKKRDKGRSSGSVRRSLKSNDPFPFRSPGRQKSLSKSVRPKTSKKKTQRHKKALSADFNRETRAAADVVTVSDVLTDRNTKKKIGNNSLQEGSPNQDDMPEPQRKDTSTGEMNMVDGETTHEFVNSSPACVFCGSTGDSEVAGPMVEYEDAFPSQGLTRMKAVHVHKLCAEWAPDVYFNEDKPENLACEVTRGRKIKCSNCGMRGAALGCCNKRCKKSFHYPCGRATPGCKWDEDDFVMFCPHHAECKFPRRKRCRIAPSKDHVLATTENGKGEILNKNATLVPSTGEQLQRWPAGPACKWVLCGSGLDSQMKEQLAAFASCTGASLVKRWSPYVTHVITGTDDKGAAKRTLKFLMATLLGKWVVKFEWMRDCMTAGHILAEDQYEVNLDVNGFIGGPKRSRALAADGGPKLLEGLSFYFCGEFTSVSKEDLQSLIAAGKGVVLQRKPLPLERSLSSSRVRTKIPQKGQTIVLYSGDDVKEKVERVEEAKLIAVHAGASAVSHTWLLDSVAACLLQPTA